MNLLTLGALAVALGSDAFSLSVGLGVAGIRLSRMVMLAALVGVFHVFMPLLGMGAGQVLGGVAGEWAGRIGAVVLVVIGGRMLWENCKTPVQAAPLSKGRSLLINPSHKSVSVVLPGRRNSALIGFWAMFGLAASVSLDALGVGVSLGAFHFNIPLTVLTLGAVAALMTFGGLLVGRRLGGVIGDKAEMAGGAILTAIGFKLFF